MVIEKRTSNPRLEEGRELARAHVGTEGARGTWDSREEASGCREGAGDHRGAEGQSLARLDLETHPWSHNHAPDMRPSSPTWVAELLENGDGISSILTSPEPCRS